MNTGIRFSILGNGRKTELYSSNESLRCLLLTRFMGVCFASFSSGRETGSSGIDGESGDSDDGIEAEDSAAASTTCSSSVVSLSQSCCFVFIDVGTATVLGGVAALESVAAMVSVFGGYSSSCGFC